MRRLARLEGGALFGARLALVARLPLLVGHAVDMRPALLLGERDAARVRRLLEPVRQAVAAEPGEVHEVDVLHVRAGAQVLHEPAQDRRLEFSPGFWIDVVHDGFWRFSVRGPGRAEKGS